MLSHKLSNKLIKRGGLFTITGLILMTAVVVSARAWLKPSAKLAEPPIAAPKLVPTAPPAPQGNSLRQALEGEVITLTTNGFEPAEITRPRGRFILMVDNRSGVGDIDLQLNRQTGARLHTVHVPREQQDWNDVLDLEPGSYVLTEAEHPKWNCRITITPQ